jgi:Protein of unknown function (DUF2934)
MSKKTTAKTTRLAPRAPVPRLSPAEQKWPIELPDGMWDRIAQKAYELWVERGRREGYQLEDWFDAESAVMEEIHEARE